MRRTYLAALIGGVALLLAACGEQDNGKSAVKETAEAVDKTADYATGRTQLQQKKKLETKLNNLQQKQQKQLDKALKEQ